MPLPKTLADLSKALRARTMFAGALEHQDPLTSLAADAIDRLAKALAPLKVIAECWAENGLDEDRPAWRAKISNVGEGRHLPKFEDVELYSGRGGKRLLSLADAFAARDALEAILSPAGSPEAPPAVHLPEEPVTAADVPRRARGPVDGTSRDDAVTPRGSLPVITRKRVVEIIETGGMTGAILDGELLSLCAIALDYFDYTLAKPSVEKLAEPFLPMNAELFGAIWDVLNGPPDERVSVSEQSAFERRARTRLLNLMPGPEAFPAQDAERFVPISDDDMSIVVSIDGKVMPPVSPTPFVSAAQSDWDDAMASRGAWASPKDAPPADEAPKPRRIRL